MIDSFSCQLFGKFHIHRHGSALCHTIGGSYINFEAAEGMNPDNCCEDCRRRFRNITGIDLRKPEINKAMLRAKTENN